jgi:hypothetical protein
MTMCAAGCCPGRYLEANQTPVQLAKDQSVLVRPMNGGPSRRVVVPAGFVVIDRPSDLEPELKPDARSSR